MIFQLKKSLSPKQVREKKPIAPKQVREKKPIAPKQVREEDIFGLLDKVVELVSGGSVINGAYPV